MSHFLQHFRSRRDRQIFPIYGQFPAAISYQIGPCLETNGLAMIFAKFWKNHGKWHFWRGAISQATRALKWPIFCNILGLLLRARFPPWFGQFRAAISRRIGPFLETTGLPRSFSKFWGVVGNLTFLTRRHSERYARTKIAHFRPHFRSPREGHISPKIWAILSRD